MLDLDEKLSNLSSLMHIMLYKWFFLSLGVLAKNMRKSLVLMEKKAMGMCFEEKK